MTNGKESRCPFLCFTEVGLHTRAPRSAGECVSRHHSRFALSAGNRIVVFWPLVAMQRRPPWRTTIKSVRRALAPSFYNSFRGFALAPPMS